MKTVNVRSFVSRSAIALVACCLLLLSCQTFEPAVETLAEICSQSVFEVNTVEEGTDPNALCRPGRSCTLRAALTSAAACRNHPEPASPRTIGLPAGQTLLLNGPYVPVAYLATMDRAHEARIGRGMLPRIYGNVIIEGRGAVIDGGPALVRLFHVPTGGSLTLRQVTLIRGGGHNRLLPTEEQSGTAVHNESVLIASDSRFEENDHDAIRNAGPAATFTATNCTFVANRRAILNEGTLRITGGSFTRNQDHDAVGPRSVGGGGAIWNSGNATIADATFSANFAARVTQGSAISSSGSLTLQACTFSRNGRTDGDGEAIYVSGNILIDQCTFTGNSGMQASSLNLLSGEATIRRSTFHAEISRGSALNCAGAAARVTLEDVTMSGNRAGLVALQIPSGCRLTVSNTLISNNTTPRNCFFATAPTISGRSLSTDASCAGFEMTGDPLLGPLTNNGGSTETQLPGTGSAVVDRGTVCLAQDQRGSPRPSGACDVGAVERQPGDP